MCLDLSHKPLRSDISIEDLQKAETTAGITIMPRDTVLLHINFIVAATATEGYLTDFPGLTKESATWLGNKGIAMFGVEAVSPRVGQAATISRYITSVGISISPTWRGFATSTSSWVGAGSGLSAFR